MGFLPRVADLNGDGFDDIITGSYFGDANKRKRSDGSGRYDRNGEYWGDVFVFWGNPDGNFQPRELLTHALMHPTPYPIDWDKDGDLDLVTISWSTAKNGIRDKSKERDPDFKPAGQVTWMENTGGKTKPDFAHPVTLIDNPPGVNENYSCVVPFDWDRDGRVDLLIGGYVHGSIYFYKNIGTPDEAVFKERVILKKGQKSDGGKECPVTEEIPWGNSLQLLVVDWDGDGVTDILAGDNASFYKPNPEYGKKELAEVAKAQKRLDAFRNRVAQLSMLPEHDTGKMTEEEKVAYFNSGKAAFTIAQKEFPTYQEDNTLVYKARIREGHGRIWLFKGVMKEE